MPNRPEQKQKNDVFELQITDMSDEGAGIGKENGFTWFVKDAVVGDRVLAGATKVKKNYGFARLVQILESSDARTTPACPIARQCGGCQLQAMSYPAQLLFKQNKVRGALQRIGGIAVESAADGNAQASANASDRRLCEQPMTDALTGDQHPLMLPILGAEAQFRYRSKAQFPFGTDKAGNPVTGFYAGRTHSIIPCADCLLGCEENKPVLEAILQWMQRRRISPYNEETGKGLVRHVLIRKGYYTGQMMVCLVINAQKLPYAEELTEVLKRAVNRKTAGQQTAELQMAQLQTAQLQIAQQQTAQRKAAQQEKAQQEKAQQRKTEQQKAEQQPGRAEQEKTEDSAAASNEQMHWPVPAVLASVSYSVNTERTNVIMGTKLVSVYGPLYIEDEIHEIEDEIFEPEHGRQVETNTLPAKCNAAARSVLRFRISPLSFYQVNPRQMERLYQTALRFAGLTGNETVWDLYCGIGTISLFLAQHAKKVYGLEIVPQAVEDARANAARNGLSNTEFFAGKAEEVLPRWYREHPEVTIDVIVTDPPRKGCDAACLETMVQMAPRRIVYVSCDAATLARDLKFLCANGYRLEQVQVVDQFAQTVHVETVAMLSRLLCHK